jgi:hypothetical protein
MNSLENRGANRNTVSFTSSEIKVVLTMNQAQQNSQSRGTTEAKTMEAAS